MLVELISFSFPAALLMWQHRDQKYLPTNNPFNLGRFGWLVNGLVVAWTAFALVIFSLPVTLPVKSGSMSQSSPDFLLCLRVFLFFFPPFGLTRLNPDYTSVILGLVVSISTLNWVFYARKHFKGPNVTLLVKK